MSGASELDSYIFIDQYHSGILEKSRGNYTSIAAQSQFREDALKELSSSRTVSRG